MKELHCAYNLTTGEVISCSNGNHLKRCVAIITKNNYRDGITYNEWVFCHKGLNRMMAKANKIGKQRLGRI